MTLLKTLTTQTVNSDNIILRLQFSRKLITTDTTGEDVALNTNLVWIWAMGSISNQGDCVISQHSTVPGEH